jgi:hypothetical protein
MCVFVCETKLSCFWLSVVCVHVCVLERVWKTSHTRTHTHSQVQSEKKKMQSVTATSHLSWWTSDVDETRAPLWTCAPFLKTKVGHILTKAAALHINLYIDGSPIASRSHTHPSHSQVSFHRHAYICILFSSHFIINKTTRAKEQEGNSPSPPKGKNRYIYLYMCMYVCMYVCMYACLYVCM